MKAKVKKKDRTIEILLGRRNRYAFVALVCGFLFAIVYIILEPSNFGSFSATLRSFLSPLSTLLSIVVSFNTLALRSELSSMRTRRKDMKEDLDKVKTYLAPAAKMDHNRQPDSNHIPALYYPDALEAMLRATKKQVETVISNIQLSGSEHHLSLQVYKEIINQINSKLETYTRHKNPFFLISIDTDAFVGKMKFASEYDNNKQTEREKELFETAMSLNVIRNNGVEIFIRSSLSKLSYEMLIFAIPTIIFIAIISTVSDSSNTLYLRLLFATGMAAVALPFLLLFVRIMPILQLMTGSSSYMDEQFMK
jgi:hypothetical protein